MISSDVVLGLGSNLGDSPAVLAGAAARLGELLTCPRQASLYLSAPLHVTEQPLFYNTAVAGRFDGPPEALLAAAQRIEAAFGRDRARETRWGPRPLDIDILLFGGRIVSTPLLEIPHPRLKERRFALVPLLELEPDAVEPGTGAPYRAFLEALKAPLPARDWVRKI
ncbi:MAG: 2-amino-4-hydroxy-6-hydroxymethyldihydropteridine diphosphokinase [Treponema sp.]|jgi:2-amino-4-hydroxy-6-hydroxymethyldihydropteridine diphosphokinase|nr:2-amino-4-hydroxy-6-hydroxymethyldihydropteridine diphosphokinase [Treponema sp.]